MVAYVYIFISLAMLFGSAFLIVRGKRNAEYEVISNRLAGVTLYQSQSKRVSWLLNQFERAGISIDKGKLTVIAVSVLVVFMLLLVLTNLIIAGIVLLFFVLLVYLALAILYQKRQEKIINQLPRFLDQVIRSMHTGKTLGDSIFNAIDSVDDPLAEILQRVKRNVSLGVSFPDAFQEVADTYAMRELQVLAMGISVNFRFGGSMSDLLANIIAFIRERERISRQLRAMTGETRMSAGVLSVVPVGMGAYLMAQNPHYILNMWNDPSGRNWIIAALGMQVAGIIIMWRMLKSL